MGYSFNKLTNNIVPKGTYKAVIREVSFKTSASGETRNDLVVRLSITEGTYDKKNLMDTIYEKAFSFRLKPLLVACNVDLNREFTTTKELYEYGIKNIQGKTVMIEVGVRTYNGQEYNEIKNYMKLPASTVGVEDVLKEFDTAAPETLSDSKPVNTVNVSKTEVESEPVEEPSISTDVDISDEDLPF